jgi:hypothetical protein
MVMKLPPAGEAMDTSTSPVAALYWMTVEIRSPGDTFTTGPVSA